METSVFEKHSIPKTYITFALPVIFNLVITIIYNMADTFFISATKNIDLIAGVSLGAPVFTVLMAFGNIPGQGGSSLISRLIGRNQPDDARSVSSFCFYGSIIMGIVITAVMILFADPLLSILGADENTWVYAKEYYMVLAYGAVFIILSFIHSNLIRSEGMAKESMIGSIGGTVINIILDPILISGFGMGAAGAAIATVIGYACSDLFLFVIVKTKSRMLSVSLRDMHISPAHLRQVIGIGVPSALSNIMSSICIILTNQYLLPYGNEKIAAMGIALKVTMIGNLILTGFCFGGSPVIGYFYGARNREKLQKLVRFCFGSVIVIGLIMGGILTVAAPGFISLFLDDPALIETGADMLRLQACGLALAGITLMSTIYTQSFGKVAGSFILSLSRQGFVFIACIMVLSALFGYHGTIAAQLCSDVISALAAVVVMYRNIISEIRQMEQ
ncbi:MAG: MATE family efflux transporter [Bulleidia sp.]